MIPDIPIETQQFVADYIPSLHHLELLLLVSALPDREWSVEAVYKVILSNTAMVAEQLEGFVKAGLFKRSGPPHCYRYAPKTMKLSAQVAILSALYKTRRHKLVELIYHHPSGELKAFSEAFKLKRNP